jgi:hypothetical protein
LSTKELEKLHVQVSLLSCYEKLGPGSWDNWVVGTHGITIEFEAGGRRYTATYLPQIPVEEGACLTIAICSVPVALRSSLCSSRTHTNTAPASGYGLYRLGCCTYAGTRADQGADSVLVRRCCRVGCHESGDHTSAQVWVEGASRRRAPSIDLADALSVDDIYTELRRLYGDEVSRKGRRG